MPCIIAIFGAVCSAECVGDICRATEKLVASGLRLWQNRNANAPVDGWIDSASDPGNSRASNRGAIFLSAKRLRIEYSDIPIFWKWVYPRDGSRYTVVAELLGVYNLCIGARIILDEQTFMHDDGTPVDETRYAAYLIFKTTNNCRALDATMEAAVTTDEGTSFTRDVYIYQASQYTSFFTLSMIELPEPRPEGGGWMELKLGRFYYGQHNRNSVVNVSLKHEHYKRMTGLIVAGIELRPVNRADRYEVS